MFHYRPRLVLRRPGIGTIAQLPLAFALSWYVNDEPSWTPTERLALSMLLVGVLIISVTVHEVAHALVGSWRTGLTGTVQLHGPLLGATTLDDSDGEPTEQWDLPSVMAGPSINLVIAGAAWFFLSRGIDNFPIRSVGPRGVHIIETVFLVNLMLGLVNLLPVNILDGGRALALVAELGPAKGRRGRVSAVDGAGLGFIGATVAYGIVHSGSDVVQILQLAAWILIAVISSTLFAPQLRRHWPGGLSGIVVGAGIAWELVMPRLW